MAAWINAPKPDPMINRSLRDDFPPELEREIVDGGVREGRPESTGFPGMVGLVFLLILGLAALGFLMMWLVFGH